MRSRHVLGIGGAIGVRSVLRNVHVLLSAWALVYFRRAVDLSNVAVGLALVGIAIVSWAGHQKNCAWKTN